MIITNRMFRYYCWLMDRVADGRYNWKKYPRTTRIADAYDFLGLGRYSLGGVMSRRISELEEKFQKKYGYHPRGASRAEIETYRIPQGPGKSIATAIGRLGEETVADILREHGFQVEHLGHSKPFDLLVENGQRFVVEVKTYLSDNSHSNMTRRTRYLKRKFYEENEAKPMTIILKLLERAEPKSKFFVGYGMGLKNVQYPWIESLDDFISSINGTVNTKYQ